MKLKSSKQVHISQATLSRIVSHCKGSLPSFVSGTLLGLDLFDRFEIFDALPLIESNNGEDKKFEKEFGEKNNEKSSLEPIGWYQSSSGLFIKEESFKTLLRKQADSGSFICIVFDVLSMTSGGTSMRAFKLSRDKNFSKSPKDNDGFKNIDFTNLNQNYILWNNVFDDIQINVEKTNMLTENLFSVVSDSPNKQTTCCLDLKRESDMRKNLDDLVYSIDMLLHEKHRINFYLRHIEKNKKLILNGKNNHNAKPVDSLQESDILSPETTYERNHMDCFRLTDKISSLCDQMIITSTQELQKINLIRSLR
jgi:hypothetical protein